LEGQRDRVDRAAEATNRCHGLTASLGKKATAYATTSSRAASVE
jgi:hypothetical protein